MSCVKNIRTDLAPTFPEGGVWTYVGYNVSNPSGSFGANPATPLINVAPTTVLTAWGDNFTIDTVDKTAGFYRLTYSVSSQTFTLTIGVESDAQCAGANVNITVDESSSTPINLFSALASTECPSPTSGGTWTNLDSATGWSAPNFTPSTAGAGVYRFKYSLFESGFTVVNCDCSLEATVTVTVVDTLSASISAVSDDCTYTMVIKHPDTATPNSIKLAVSSNSIVATYNRLITSCSGTITTPKSTSVSPIGITLITSQSLGTGGYIDHFTLKTTTGATITVPLSPTTAILTGVGGTITAAQLTFLSVSPAIFSTAIYKAILNYLDSLGYTDGTHFKLTAVNYLPTNRLRITFGAKHNPGSLWMGISTAENELEFYPNGSSVIPVLDEDDWSPSVPSFVMSEVYANAPCPTGATQLSQTFAISTLGQMNLTSFDFDTIELTNTTVAVTPTGTATTDCAGYELTATGTPCSGTLSYLWSTGDTSSSITVQNGTYTVTVTCSDPSASDDATITV